MTKSQRFRLSQGSNFLVEPFNGPAPLPVAAEYDFEPGRNYQVVFKGNVVGHCSVERDDFGVLWTIPDFEIAFDNAEFHPFWQVRAASAALTRVLPLSHGLIPHFAAKTRKGYVTRF